METTPDSLRERLRDLMTAKGTDPTRLSRQIGRSKDYIRDFLEGRKESLSFKSMVAVENLLEVERGFLTSVTPIEPTDRILRTGMGPYGSTRERSQLIDVYPSREILDGKGELLVRAFPIETVPRPMIIPDGVRAYGLLIEAETMLPAYEPGDIVITNCDLGMRKNTDAVLNQFVPKEDIGDDPWAKSMVVRLLDYDAENITVKQYNPVREIALLRKEWASIDRIVAKYHKR